jgi:small conductance mechanosensitive channel
MTSLVPTLALVLLTQPAPPTGAERIARLERAIESAGRELEALRIQYPARKKEYDEAGTSFNALEERLIKGTRELQRLRTEGKKEAADALERELTSLGKRRQRARERFDLAIQEHKAIQEKREALEKKLGQDRQELDRLLGPGDRGEARSFLDSLVHPTKKAALLEALTGQGTPHEAPPGRDDVPPEEKHEASALAAAKERATRAEEAARRARERATGVEQRIKTLQESVAVEQALKEAARRKADLARQTRHALELAMSRVAEPQRERLALQVGKADQRYAEALDEERSAGERLSELQQELQETQSDRLVVMREAEQKRRQAASATRSLRSLENPFTLRNLLLWLIAHGPRLLCILAFMLVAVRVARRLCSLLVRVVARHPARGESAGDRADTLASILRGTARFVILAGGFIMILDEVGLPVAALMGGAAILGLAAAFGAQNLTKDYFTGFMVLLEDQYAVNDAVRINGIDGKVERITLRLTVLRDQAGVVHFVPYGAIATVSNFGHGWSRASLKLRVGYGENIDRVLDVLADLCTGMRRDPVFGPLIVEDGEILGVDELTDSGVIVRLLLKTLPQQHGRVRREMLRRVKLRFEQAGIEIPFPQQVLHHPLSERRTA